MPLITPTASQSIDIEDRSKISTPNDNMVGIRKRDVRKNKDRVVKVSGIDHPSKKLKVSSAKFGELTVSTSVSRALKIMGYEMPTPVQMAVIPVVREGKDVVGQAQTGTGKTAAFGIPTVEKIDKRIIEPQALILTPTRELAVQVNSEIGKLGQFLSLRSTAIYGGQPLRRQLSDLEKHPHIIVATPGRLLDHMERRTISLNKIRIVVLDEADQMLDIGFAPDIERILRRTPKSRQTMLFSATMPHLIKRLVNRYLSNPVWTRVGGESEPVTQVEQIYYEVAERDRALAIVNILGEPGAIEQALVFRRTKMGVDKLMLHLKRKGYEVEAIHGDMPQTRRDRVMSGFRKKLIPILIATNVAARGLDIPAVSHVINYDMPSNLEEYVHRIGRTARMGRPGTAITFVSEWDFDTLDLIRSHVGEDLKRQHLSFLYT